MNAKILIPVVLFAILGAIVYLNDNKIYAAPSTRLSVPLTEKEFQFLPNHISFHMDNQSSGGAVEVVSNETGQNVTQYFKYNPDRNSVTVSNSTITADFSIQIPEPNDPNTVKINRINLPLLDVYFISKGNTKTGEPVTVYDTAFYNIPITIGNSTYNKMSMLVIIPKVKNDIKQQWLCIYIHK